MFDFTVGSYQTHDPEQGGAVMQERFVTMMSQDVGGTPGPIGQYHLHSDGSENYCRRQPDSEVVSCTACGEEESTGNCPEYYPKHYG